CRRRRRRPVSELRHFQRRRRALRWPPRSAQAETRGKGFYSQTVLNTPARGYVGGKAPHSSDRVMWTVSAGHCAGGRTSRLRWSGLPQSPTGRAGRSLGWWTPAPAPGFQFFRAEALDRVGRTRRDPAEPGAAVPEAPKVFLTHHRYHSLCISSDSSKFTLSALSVWSRDVRSVTTRRC